MEWKGYLLIPEDGSYKIITKSDDGVIFSINDIIKLKQSLSKVRDCCNIGTEDT